MPVYNLSENIERLMKSNDLNFDFYSQIDYTYILLDLVC